LAMIKNTRKKVLPLILPIPSAYEFSSETTTASTATVRLITALFNSLVVKSTRFQKSIIPVRLKPCGKAIGPLLAYSTGVLKALMITIKKGTSMIARNMNNTINEKYLPTPFKLRVLVMIFLLSKFLL